MSSNYIPYQKRYTPEQLRDEAKNLADKHIDRVPIVVESIEGEKLPDGLSKKNKFLVPKDLAYGQFLYVIRQRIKLKPEEAIFLFIKDKNILPVASDTVGRLFEQYSIHGFLFTTLAFENVFG